VRVKLKALHTELDAGLNLSGAADLDVLKLAPNQELTERLRREKHRQPPGSRPRSNHRPNPADGTGEAQ
jgi:hypothetical protein